jgi:hypothetical protein
MRASARKIYTLLLRCNFVAKPASALFSATCELGTRIARMFAADKPLTQLISDNRWYEPPFGLKGGEILAEAFFSS